MQGETTDVTILHHGRFGMARALLGLGIAIAMSGIGGAAEGQGTSPASVSANATGVATQAVTSSANTPAAGKGDTSKEAASTTDDNAEAEIERRKQEREKELDDITKNMQLSAKRQEELSREIQKIDNDRQELNSDMLKTADRVKTLEGQLGDTEDRLKQLGAREDSIRESLAKRNGVLSEVLAALERIGRRPPPALVVRPSDALAAVRSAMLLNSVLPEIRIEAQALAADLQELKRVRDATNRDTERLRGEASRLAEQRSRLELLLAAKRDQQQKSEQQLADEKKHAEDLASRATSLKDLIGQLENKIASVHEAAEAAKREAEAKKHGNPDHPFSDPGRLAPEVAFADTKGHLPFPVAGKMIRDFGQADEFGSVTEGQSIATRPGVRVVSPADGWVVYAGPFRSFGHLLILNTGGGYHVLLAGMDRIDVELGQFVLAGEPVGVMGSTHWASASTFGLGSSQPVLYVEFRKDGSAIDPTPWWSRTEEEKVRG